MGPWAWDSVRRDLHERGHRVHAVALTGLDGADDVSAVTLETHVDDVLAVLEDNLLKDVILVAHGTSGVVAGIVADRLPERIEHTVYVEGFLAHDGRTTLGSFSAGLRDEEVRLIDEHGGRWPVPDVTVVAEGQGLSPEQAERLVRRFVPHPGRALSEPAVLKKPITAQRSTYIVCAKEHFDTSLADDIEAMAEEPNWTFRTLDTGLWPMVSAPAELSALLDDIATDSGLRRSG
jgi:pimeloyl-ACP methyl ester carboxylesterase